MTELGQMLREDGIKESKIEIARNMLMEQLPLPLIKKITGLSLAEIESINSNLKN